jgi:hypothetical protein
MHEFAASAAKVSLNQTHVSARSVAPNESEYCSEKDCVTPAPELGETADAAIVGERHV